MQMASIPFGTTDWSQLPPTEHRGEHGFAHWRTQLFGTIRVRMVDYSPGYLANHWCVKGHILLCIEGELHTELEDLVILLSTMRLICEFRTKFNLITSFSNRKQFISILL